MMECTALKMAAMFRRIGFLAGGMALFLLAASCTPNTSPGTKSSGPVVISTDHSVYATTDSLQVTVTNQLPVDIYAFDEGASCSLLGLEMQTQGKWQLSSRAQCPQKHPPLPFRIASGHSYTVTINAGEPGLYQATFPPGRYRLLFEYTTVAAKDLAVFVQSSSTIYSASFTIQG